MQQRPHQADRHDGDRRRQPERPVRTHPGAGIAVVTTVVAAAVVTGVLITKDTGRAPGTTRAGLHAVPAPPGRPPATAPASTPATAPRALPTSAYGDAGTPRTRRALAGGAAATYAERILALVNAERAKAGCRALRTDGRLQEAAQGHADDMAARGYYGHDSPEGRDAGDRMEAAGYTWQTWGENIHRGVKSPTRAMRDWMASAGHRKNVVNCAFRDVGVGVNLRSNGPWWVQNFGTAG
ncbi:CAP domain-containing protein [Streptomyces ficellus]|uniref:CAP domain-containing protein n=1 Tax=Streptomyces ficellus TaxID=1977088 RepID=UPI00142E968A|nr:CAP domain-containing protein [Streptomyces ficellus]